MGELQANAPTEAAAAATCAFPPHPSFAAIVVEPLKSWSCGSGSGPGRRRRRAPGRTRDEDRPRGRAPDHEAGDQDVAARADLDARRDVDESWRASVYAPAGVAS